MDKLTEEILELQREGEVLICMDANVPVGTSAVLRAPMDEFRWTDAAELQAKINGGEPEPTFSTSGDFEADFWIFGEGWEMGWRSCGGSWACCFRRTWKHREVAHNDVLMFE